MSFPSPEQSLRSNKEQSPLEKSQNALADLTQSFNHFMPRLDVLFAGAKGEELWGRVCAGRFTSAALARLGIKGEDSRVLYGDWNPVGNVEGSLYTLFGDNILRVRWARGTSLYLNWDNEVRFESKEGGGYTLQPHTIEGLRIQKITEQGIETEDPEAYPPYRRERLAYEGRLEREKGFVGKVRRAARVVGIGRPLVPPVEPDPIIIPHEQFIAVMGTMREGLQKTLTTLRQARR